MILKRRGKVETFEKIYDLYFKDVYRFLLALCHDAAEAEEVTQETFFQAMSQIDNFRGDCKIVTWLCQIAKYTYYARQQKRKRFSEQEFEELDEAKFKTLFPSMEIAMQEESEALRIHTLLHHLAEPYKEVFMLRVFGELSYKKIAYIFGKTESWARVTYYRARLKLINEMEDDNGKNFV